MIKSFKGGRHHRWFVVVGVVSFLISSCPPIRQAGPGPTIAAAFVRLTFRIPGLACDVDSIGTVDWIGQADLAPGIMPSQDASQFPKELTCDSRPPKCRVDVESPNRLLSPSLIGQEVSYGLILDDGNGFTTNCDVEITQGTNRVNFCFGTEGCAIGDGNFPCEDVPCEDDE